MTVYSALKKLVTGELVHIAPKVLSWIMVNVTGQDNIFMEEIVKTLVIHI